ncbi:hypothetical protein TeGR_g120 [Tetraparma gracilis]|uniref:Peptide deformylase n=1 Tax=Tetraparma gracilis TaxID=2962635 RepID=A0ABQ6MIU1_9STRA|nr:hypothetical protein TeGR_g120 [Tetraparma gracilis]
MSSNWNIPPAMTRVHSSTSSFNSSQYSIGSSYGTPNQSRFDLEAFFEAGLSIDPPEPPLECGTNPVSHQQAFCEPETVVKESLTGPLVIAPDLRLRNVVPRVSEETSLHDICTVGQELINCVVDNDGAGTAAPQVGCPLRIIVVSTPAERAPKDPSPVDGVRDPFVIVNPELDVAGAAQVMGWERCLSVPKMVGAVSRPGSVTLRGEDPLTRQALKPELCGGHLSRLLQHEVDHLDGILYTDRVEAGSLMKIDTFQNIQKAEKEGDLGPGESLLGEGWESWDRRMQIISKHPVYDLTGKGVLIRQMEKHMAAVRKEQAAELFCDRLHEMMGLK